MSRIAVSNRSFAVDEAGRWIDRRSHWRVKIGPISVSRSHRELRYVAPVPSVSRMIGGRSQPLRGLLAACLALVVMSAGLSWGFAAQASNNRPRFVVPILDVVEPVRTPIPAIVESEPATDKAATPNAKATETSESQGASDMADATIAGSAHFDRFPAVRRAIETAFETGEAQDWSEGLYQGLVVAGEAYADGGRTCRDTAILLRDGSFDGKTKSITTCRKGASTIDG